MRERLHTVIFGTSTRAGKNFDLVLLFIILASVLIVLLESMPSMRARYGEELSIAEWGFTIVFSIEYLIRIWISPKPLRYIISFWGIIDIVSIIPTFISPFITGSHSLAAIRALRLLRIYRILKLSRFTSESQMLLQSLRASYYRIMVFMFFVVMMMILAGTAMYVIEGGENGFESIPASIYWAIVTTTTVGYGDITPTTGLGKILSSIMMILGYVIIAVPTGLISVEIAKQRGHVINDNECDACGHDNPSGSVYCNQCGKEMTNT
ncbi:MAG: ion transporter [Fluviicola sp. XM-24bin1]|nr:MAG: ion transporter [Fluviicola sp. XM-24bin1]